MTSAKSKNRQNGLEILDRRFFAGKPEMQALLVEAEAEDAASREVYKLRTGAGLSQRQLARLVDVPPSVIAQLEDGDYSGNLLGMLGRVAAVLNRRVEFRFPHVNSPSKLRKRRPTALVHAAEDAVGHPK